jgi:hypothetical protein
MIQGFPSDLTWSGIALFLGQGVIFVIVAVGLGFAIAKKRWKPIAIAILSIFLLVGLSVIGVAGLRMRSHYTATQIRQYGTPPGEYLGQTIPSTPAPIPPEVFDSIVRSQSLQNSTGVDLAASPAWLEADQFFLQSDIYPSAAAAIRGLTAQAVDLLADVAPDPAAITHATLLCPTINDRKLTVEAEEVLRRLAPTVQVAYVKPPAGEASLSPLNPQAISLQVAVVLDAESATEPNVVSYESASAQATVVQGNGWGRFGHVQLTLTGSSNALTRTAPFVDKPWVDRFNEVTSQFPNRHWIIARSTKPALSPEEARQFAIEDAVGQLLPQMPLQVPPFRPVSIESAATNLRQALHDGKLISDQFIRRFKRPGGDVHEARLLLQADQAILAMITRQTATAQQMVLRAQRTSGLGIIASLAAILGVTVMLYLFLNVMTKGYYALPLRLAAGLMVALGLVLLWIVFR